MRIIPERIETFEIPDDKDGAKLKVKYLNAGERQELLQAVNDVKFVANKDGEEELSVTPNGVKLREAVVIARVQGWEKMLDEKGKKLECNNENKILFSRQDNFMEILNKMIEQLDKMVSKDAEKDSKNS